MAGGCGPEVNNLPLQEAPMDLPPQPKTNPKTTQYQEKWKRINKAQKAKSDFMQQVLKPLTGPRYPIKQIPVD